MEKGSRDLLLELRDPLYISETSNLARILSTKALTKKCKVVSKGSLKGHVTYFFEFLNLSLFRERLKLETSNLTCILNTTDINENVQRY